MFANLLCLLLKLRAPSVIFSCELSHVKVFFRKKRS